MKKPEIFWTYNGWTTLQEADAKTHTLGIACRSENETIVEVRVRHNDGEEKQGEVTYEGKKVLPMALAEFSKLYEAGKLTIK